MLQGLQEDFFKGEYHCRSTTSSSGQSTNCVLLNTTSSFSGLVGFAIIGGAITGNTVAGGEVQVLGYNFLTAAEQGDGVNSTSFVGDGGLAVQITGLQYARRF